MGILKKSFFAIFLACAACSFSTYDYLPVSEFTIDMNALKNHDTVEVIGSSGGPDHNEDKEYYYQYFVVSQSSGDTVRVLSLPVYDFESMGGKTKVFIAANSDNEMDKVILKEFFNAEPDKVVFNKKHDPSLKTRYRTITGIFAEANTREL